MADLLFSARPIPPLCEPPHWARLPVAECGEPLVALIPAERLRVQSAYALQKIPGASETILLRSGAAERLTRAAAALPPGIALCVFDGYRPLAVQRALYDAYWAETAAAHPDLPDNEIALLVGRFVATPSADPTCPPPHRTGGAVDVYLVDAATGAPLPMGSEPDATVPESATRFYEDVPAEPFRTHRRVLFHAMAGAGFTNYRNEWWHFDWGNQRWANCANAPAAVYGIAPTNDTDSPA